MKRPHTGIGSTRPNDITMMAYHIPTQTNLHCGVETQYVVPEDTNRIPEDPTDAVNNIFYFASLADKQKGALYIYDTGSLSSIPFDGHQYFFVLYDCDTY